MQLLIARSYSQIDYSLRCMFPMWSNYDVQYTRKGLIKKWIRQALTSLSVVAGIVILYHARKQGQSFATLSDVIRQRARGLVAVFSTIVERGVSIIQSR